MDSYDVLLELVLQKWRVVVWADQGELQKKIQKKTSKSLFEGVCPFVRE